MKKYLFLIIAIITTLLSTVSFAERPIIVEVNGEKLWFNDVQPQIINGRTMVPIRSVSEALGLNVQWDSKTGMVILDDGYNVIRVTINSNNAKINDVNFWMDVPAQIINNRTMVPIRFISEGMGYDVFWRENYTDNCIEVIISNDLNNIEEEVTEYSNLMLTKQQASDIVLEKVDPRREWLDIPLPENIYLVSIRGNNYYKVNLTMTYMYGDNGNIRTRTTSVESYYIDALSGEMYDYLLRPCR